MLFNMSEIQVVNGQQVTSESGMGACEMALILGVGGLIVVLALWLVGAAVLDSTTVEALKEGVEVFTNL